MNFRSRSELRADRSLNESGKTALISAANKNIFVFKQNKRIVKHAC